MVYEYYVYWYIERDAYNMLCVCMCYGEYNYAYIYIYIYIERERDTHMFSIIMWHG